MIDKNRLSNYNYYQEPFPILIFKNFLNESEAKQAINCIENQEFDETVNEGRNNIRKGTKSFQNTIEKKNILSMIYSFFNNEEVFEDLLKKLQKVSELSKNNYKIHNKPTNFKKDFYEYKRSVHNKNYLKRIANFFSNKLFKKKFLEDFFYFEVNFSVAKKGYKLKTHKDKDNRMVVFLLYLNKLDETGGSFEIYSKEGGVSNKNFKLEKQFQPEAGKLLVFLSNPLSYHNVSEILKSESKRFFCYGGYTSLNNIIWKK